MGTAKRKPRSALIAELLDDPSSFEFFRAVQVLEAHLAEADGRRRRKRVGFDHLSSEVGVEFGAAATLAFPSTPLASVRRSGDGGSADEQPAGEPFEVLVSFLGLIGPAGTLPVHYTETLLQRVHVKDTSLRAFLDKLQDRTVALFYRAWKKYRLPISYGLADHAQGETDPVLGALLGLVGRRPRPRGKALGAEELAEVYHAGLFSDRRRSAHGLQTMLRGLLGCEVRVEQFVGQWIELDADACSRLGGDAGPGVQARLGDETVLGTRVWSVDSRVRVITGPLDRRRFRELWPGGARVRYIRKLLRTYLGPLIEYDLEWQLAPDAPGPLRLGGDQLLGRDCWLGWGDGGTPDLRVSSPDWNTDPHAGSPADLGIESQTVTA